MFRIRYTEWDGRQEVRLEAPEVFRKLSERLFETDDLRQALESLMREGLRAGDQDISGLDQMLEDLRAEMRQRYRDANLDHALDEVQERLERLRESEQEARRRRGRDEEVPDVSGKRPSEAIDQWQAERLDSDEARRQLESLRERLADIRDLEGFIRQYGDLFHGDNALGFDEAVEMMREMEQLRQLEQALASGSVGALRPEDLRQALGEDAARDFELLRRLPQIAAEGGFLTLGEAGPRLSPRGVRRIGQIALREIYRSLVQDRLGDHATRARGRGEVQPDRTRAYTFGDPMHLDLVGTLRKAVPRRRGVPLSLEPGDFEVFDTESATTTSTVLLLDMSWSMSWEGRFAAAKKVTLALEQLVRSQYPRDYLGIVGFFTKAIELKVKDLPEASWNMGDPFTNLQDGLRLAARLLGKHPSRNRQVIVITDGQPTAYFSGGRLYCEWPLSFGGLSMRAAAETLKEVERVTRLGIRVNTFMLDDSPALRGFVEKVTRINRGRAFFTRPDQLGEYVLVDYVGRRRRKL